MMTISLGDYVLCVGNTVHDCAVSRSSVTYTGNRNMAVMVTKLILCGSLQSSSFVVYLIIVCVDVMLQMA